MLWTTWRQHRLEALCGLTAVVVAVAVAGYGSGQARFVDSLFGLSLALWLGLLAAPVLAGAFVGAPLLARDLEQGTHRLVWTQGTTRARWLLVKLLLVFAVVLAAGAALGAVSSALVAVNSTSNPWLWFDEQGPALAAYVVFGLALGIAIGVIVRRVYPAMALTLVLVVVLRALVGLGLRPRYLPPLAGSISQPGSIPDGRGLEGAWLIGIEYRDASGHALSLDQVLGLANRHHGDLVLSHLGVVGTVLYQPADRFWTFQAIEAGIFTALAALLVGLTLYQVLRRLDA